VKGDRDLRSSFRRRYDNVRHGEDTLEVEFAEEDCVVRLGISVIITWTRILRWNMQASVPERRLQEVAGVRLRASYRGLEGLGGICGVQNRTSL
jgi:hypothetical protein